MALISTTDLALLPRWAIVALLARCGRRLLPLYEADKYEPQQQRATVAQAIRLVERRAEVGGASNALSDPLVLEGQYFDNYDIDAVHAALKACVSATSNTYDDVGVDARVPFGIAALAQHAFEVAFAADLSLEGQGPTELTKLAEAAIGWAAFAEPTAVPAIRADYGHLAELAGAEHWSDDTPVASSMFGELWPTGMPPGWPAQSLAFRPRARIIRTIGDRLISGPEAAVIELIKNSHDADASSVRVSFVPPLRPNEGMIVVEDDGHGMSLADIEQKWMEPATDDKRERKRSPGGRRLLGSKGIGRFAAARLGRYLELTTSSDSGAPGVGNGPAADLARQQVCTTRIPQIDWNAFDSATYLEEVRFPVESLPAAPHTGTTVRISALRELWSEQMIQRLHQELRRLISPVRQTDATPFRIFLDLSQCTTETCGFDGSAILRPAESIGDGGAKAPGAPYEVQPFPLLEACDYVVDGAFDESGVFSGTMEIRRGNVEPERVFMNVPLSQGVSEAGCGVVLVRLHIFDREPAAVRATAEKAGIGSVGVREARRLLDSIAGVAIYREGFRVRPYGDGENDWLTLDAKRVQNPTMKIGRNQVAGIVTIDDEESSNLVERSSREGLEENDSFRRLQTLILTLLAEVVEPRRRQFRLSAGLEARQEANFHDVYRQVQLGWSKLLVAKLPAADRAEAEALVARETDRLTAYLKRLEERQAQLEAKVTMGLIVGEVMHQGNTPLSFLETESSRLARWWPHLLEPTSRAVEDRAEVPRILHGMTASTDKLRALFDALSPLSGARRGNPKAFDPISVLEQTRYLFQTRLDRVGIRCEITTDAPGHKVVGYPDDLATAATNLLDNAIYWLDHHGIEAPRIGITVQFTDGKCRIRIADNGRGIPADFAAQVFDVGFTLKPNGTGLGLSIAREAIARSGGELALLGEESGAVFEIALPAEVAA